MKNSAICISVLLLILSVFDVQGQGSDLYELAKIKNNVKSKRVSSFDKTGGNGDCLGGIQPGEKRIIFDAKGAGVIKHIWVTIAPPPPDLSRNDIVIRMYWDGSDIPSVESPIGPFFGQGWDESYPFSCLPLAAGPVEGRAMVSYFIMPFSNGAKIEIENQAAKKIDAFYYYIDYEEVDKLPEDLGRFHAWYNHELTEAPETGENEWGSTSSKTDVNPTGAKNYLIADIKGKGHFIGVNYYINSPTPIWYGEGDDMFFIDGEQVPTLHGTGTEDYFNGSWCPKTVFSHPYFGYARVNNDIGWLGRTHVFRFHISDPVYFDKSLKFTIEHGHANHRSPSFLHLPAARHEHQNLLLELTRCTNGVTNGVKIKVIVQPFGAMNINELTNLHFV